MSDFTLPHIYDLPSYTQTQIDSLIGKKITCKNCGEEREITMEWLASDPRMSICKPTANKKNVDVITGTVTFKDWPWL